jgi:hypothetical protein
MSFLRVAIVYKIMDLNHIPRWYCQQDCIDMVKNVAKEVKKDKADEGKMLAIWKQVKSTIYTNVVRPAFEDGDEEEEEEDDENGGGGGGGGAGGGAAGKKDYNRTEEDVGDDGFE